MELSRLLKALGDPTRLRIFQSLLERKHCIRSLSKKLNITESAVSQHMKILREADMVYGQKYGYHTHYLPKQEALDFLHESFGSMKLQSATVDRDMTRCQCEYRTDTEENKISD